MTFSISEMTTTPSTINGLHLLNMKAVTDDRGTVREFYRSSTYSTVVGGDMAWRQVNVTETKYGAVRGLHGEAMTKLVACVSGEAYGVYLDARPDSSSYGEVVSFALTAGAQVLVPAGVCNGFQSVSEGGCQYLYCFTSEWTPGMAGMAFNPLDQGLGIEWPLPIDVDDPACISVKDANAANFSQSN